jgi:hypothetical protein
MLKRIGIVGAVAWVTPVVTSLNTPAFAASGPTGGCSDPGTCDPGFTQCVGADCFCFKTATGGVCGSLAFCSDLTECGTNGECRAGFVCVIESCCGTPVCVPVCGSAGQGLRKAAGSGPTLTHR